MTFLATCQWNGCVPATAQHAGHCYFNHADQLSPGSQSIALVTVLESSGFPFDRAAIKTVQDAAPYPHSLRFERASDKLEIVRTGSFAL